MTLNGFAVGKRLWVEIICNSMRADFLGKLKHITETEGENYLLQFHGGFTLSFNKADLDAGRVAVRLDLLAKEEQEP